MNFEALFSHLQAVYGRNNSVYITSLSGRIDLLLMTIHKLQDSVRKQRSKDVLANRIAHAVARTFAVAGHFWQLPLVAATCVKYPRGGCGYCHKSPCDGLCHQNGEDPAELPPEPAQLLWSLGDHQKNLAHVYGETNREQGIENAINRLFSEVAEITLLVAGLKHAGSRAEKIQWEYAKEIADVFAWIMAVATILEVDAQDATMNMYDRGCPECFGIPCTCPKLIIVDGEIRHRIDSVGTRPQS